MPLSRAYATAAIPAILPALRDLFEVGGKRKSFAQIKDLPNSYLAVDDLEVGYGNRIPLWMFGLLY